MQLDWFLLEYDSHRSMQDYVRRLNHIYTGSPELYEIEDRLGRVLLVG